MRKILNRAGALLGVLFLISVVDMVFAGFLEPKELCRIFPGTTEFVAGKVSVDRIPSLDDLKIVADSPLLTMEFVEAKGRIWRGKLHAAASMEAGSYHFKTLLRWQKPAEEETEFRVLVFTDKASYQKSFHSVLRRNFGIPPWTITALTFPLLLVCLYFAFKLTSQDEALLNKEGLATVFKVTRRKDGCEVSFGLGAKDGIKVGDSLWVINQNHQPIGQLKVTHVAAAHASGAVDSSIEVAPNFLVRKV